MLKKALILFPEHAPALHLLARIYCEAEQYAVALPYLKTLRRLRPEDPGVLFNTGVSLRELGRIP